MISKLNILDIGFLLVWVVAAVVLATGGHWALAAVSVCFGLGALLWAKTR